MSDGQIVIQTLVDTAGAQEGLTRLRQNAMRLGNSYEDTSARGTSSFNSFSRDVSDVNNQSTSSVSNNLSNMEKSASSVGKKCLLD